MSDEQSKDKKKKIARTLHELYPYPTNPVKSVACGAVWLVSFLTGVIWPYFFAATDTTDTTALGGACLMFAVSMWIEFYPENTGQYREDSFAWAFHGIFLSIMLVMGIHAAFLMLIHSYHKPNRMLLFYTAAVGFRMGIGMIFAAFSLPKRIYDAEAEEKKKQEEIRRQKEAEYQQLRKLFTDNAGSSRKGGDET